MAGILVVFGTRPEAIKLAPVVAALRSRGIPTRICVTAQHRELLDRALGSGLTPDIDLNLMRPGQSLAVLTGRMVAALDRVFAAEQPERVIVQGDTATALAAAQAAYFRAIPIAHVEAGLRTGDLDAPHPEEGNRRMIGAVADMHFAPTAAAAAALRNEGIAAERIHLTGNTVVDALHAVRARLRRAPVLAGPARDLLDRCAGRRLILVTCHRRESFGAAPEIAAAIRALATRPDVLVALPLHPNPAIRHPLENALRDTPNVALLDPLDFAPFVSLLSAAYLVLTDSGGVQEEAPVLGTPVLVMRDVTERPEGVAAGTARLVGTRAQRIVSEACLLLDNPAAHARMARAHSPYGDGRAADRIVEIIAKTHDYGAAATAFAD
ncbi:UDP-N-acetylglucosamine 2-epimerase [Sphingomonas changbaiensis NBRC 104936]|uniref:UDP-N-acetylglucosamine 2-epimerase (non-hydrolyzing) n=1 Tax=Sphingomonas changbaiensis NBRC 104936 TaxID=1219043 RepID=A0A0E9MNF8_9SPHN|nr:UDP-N-acetylglucosamine 2-epimerase (non-hydrolyzing) [Sphingomonas changbaiensis]GAO39033.1 UDP-N-acetylglucosamine 2-epimerase [Sphingomonas changbaiensis NBRC 104936]